MTNWILILNLVLYGINIGLSLHETKWILAYTFKKEN